MKGGYVMRKTILFIAMSLDGFIADKNGKVFWLAGEDANQNDMITYETFIQGVDTVIMGANTYHQLRTEISPKQWIYPTLTSYIITHQTEASTEKIRFTMEDPVALIRHLKTQLGKDIWICGGASIVNQIKQADSIDRYHINVIPTLLGTGIRLFHNTDIERKLTLLHTQSYNGIVDLVYERRTASSSFDVK